MAFPDHFLATNIISMGSWQNCLHWFLETTSKHLEGTVALGAGTTLDPCNIHHVHHDTMRLSHSHWHLHQKSCTDRLVRACGPAGWLITMQECKTKHRVHLEHLSPWISPKRNEQLTYQHNQPINFFEIRPHFHSRHFRNSWFIWPLRKPQKAQQWDSVGHQCRVQPSYPSPVPATS